MSRIYLPFIFGRRREERALAEELQQHLAERIDMLRGQGMSEE
jgi:hypothetical protein